MYNYYVKLGAKVRAGANYYVKLGAKVQAGANLGALQGGEKFGSKCIFCIFFRTKSSNFGSDTLYISIFVKYHVILSLI